VRGPAAACISGSNSKGSITVFKRHEPHPIADLFPPMSADELEMLIADVNEHGLGEVITLHRDGRILDGRHRGQVCDNLGIEIPPEMIKTFEGSDEEALAFALSKNWFHRHLSQQERRRFIATFALAHPKLSWRRIGEMLRVDHHTVKNALDRDREEKARANEQVQQFKDNIAKGIAKRMAGTAHGEDSPSAVGEIPQSEVGKNRQPDPFARRQNRPTTAADTFKEVADILDRYWNEKAANTALLKDYRASQVGDELEPFIVELVEKLWFYDQLTGGALRDRYETAMRAIAEEGAG
jgi:hypothetical protein